MEHDEFVAYSKWWFFMANFETFRLLPTYWAVPKAVDFLWAEVSLWGCGRWPGTVLPRSHIERQLSCLLRTLLAQSGSKLLHNHFDLYPCRWRLCIYIYLREHVVENWMLLVNNDQPSNLFVSVVYARTVTHTHTSPKVAICRDVGWIVVLKLLALQYLYVYIWWLLYMALDTHTCNMYICIYAYHHIWYFLILHMYIICIYIYIDDGEVVAPEISQW